MKSVGIDVPDLRDWRKWGGSNMPVAVSYPGVYIDEIPSGVRTIVGVPTSITASGFRGA